MSSQWKKRRTTLAMAVVVALYGTLAVSDDSAAQESQPGDSSTAKTLPKVRVEADETGYTVPSVTSATFSPAPCPYSSAVTPSISRMPGPPFGPS